jgi:hypothetical protein
MAGAGSSARLWTSSLLKICARWVLTVSGAMTSLGDLAVREPGECELGDPRLCGGQRAPAAGWAPGRAAPSSRPLKRVLDAQVGVLGPRGVAGVFAKRFAWSAVDLGPVPVLGRDADDPELGPDALGSAEQAYTVLVGVECGGDLRECAACDAAVARPQRRKRG